MATKKDNRYIQKATDDEELFILMGRDSTAPEVVLEWIKLNFRKQPEEKLREAFETAINLAKSEARHIVMQKAIDTRGARRNVEYAIPRGTKIESRQKDGWKVEVESAGVKAIVLSAYENQNSVPARLTFPYPMPGRDQQVVIIAKYDGSVDVINADDYDEQNPFWHEQ